MKSFNHIIPSRAKVVAFAFLLSLALVACGGDSGSNAISESSSDSVAEASSGGGKGNSSGSGVPASSSSVKEGGSSSSVETDEKSSSSVDKNGSSSSGIEGTESSSSSSQNGELNCKWFCVTECEGTTRWRNTTVKEVCQAGEWLNIDSLENLNKSSSSYYDMAEQFNPDIEYGSMTDLRDGKIYKTVKVKYGLDGVDSLTIFAENLNYGQMVAGGSIQGDATKYCYNDDPWYCDNGFGGLYSWSNAMNFPAACDSNALGTEKCPNKFVLPSGLVPRLYVIHQGICPDGWHVMNEGEWDALLERSGESLFYSVYGSKALFYMSDNKYGVSILPGGYWNLDSKKYEQIDKTALFFCPRDDKSDSLAAYYIAISSGDFARDRSLFRRSAAYIRCVQNY